MNLENYIKDLPPDLQEKARACGSVEDLLALAKEAQIPVPDEALEAIAGGDGSDPENCKREIKCPKCGSKNYKVIKKYQYGRGTFYRLKCNNCGYEWEIMD